MISIYTLTSPLHDKAAVDASTNEFLSSLGIRYEMKGEDYSSYGESDLNIIYVRTGGTEGVLKPLLPSLLGKTRQPVYLLTSGKSNSLAASMEILSYLRQNGVSGEIIHGNSRFITERILCLEKIESARRQYDGKRLGVIGKPSDWLIASAADYDAIRQKTGIEIVDIPMSELLETISSIEEDPSGARIACGKELFDAPQNVKDAAPGAYRIYKALKILIV